MKAKVGIIGGTGVGDRLLSLGGAPLHVPTSEGIVRGRLVRHADADIFVTNRHSVGHTVVPHRIGYRALALGMKALGVRLCLATAAVGSLRTDWAPGTLVACSDFLDLTARNLTLFERQVIHRDFTEPFSAKGREALLAAAASEGLTVQSEGIYLGLNGPRYETPQEIRSFRALGADLVGMTASSEAILMREAEVPYACLGIVTNFACGLAPETLDHHDVVRAMEASGPAAVRILLAACGLVRA